MTKGYGCALIAAAMVFAFSLSPASATTLLVTQDMGSPCVAGLAMFSTIQSAVNAASKGDIVEVCSGTYAEQVSIIRGITLEAAPMQSVTVAVPNNQIVQNATDLSGFPTAAQILVQPVLPRTNVIIKNITVDGSNNNDNSCGLDLVGIYYQNAGGTISGNTLQNQMLPAGYQGCQDGLGILVENQTANTGKVTISSNTVINFDKNGITVSYPAANANIVRNTVTGIGATTLLAQNGIQLGYGATGTIATNTVSNMIYSPDTAGSSGILLYDSQQGTYLTPPAVTGNTVNSTQYAVVLDAVNGTSAALVKVSGNKIANSQFAGVGLYSDGSFSPPLSDDYINVAANKIQNSTPYDGIDACSDNNTITGNTVINSPTESAVHLDDSCTEPDSSMSGIGNTVTRNHLEVACIGILIGQSASQNTIGTGMESNVFTDVTTEIVENTNSYMCSPGHDAGRTTSAGAVAKVSPAPARF